MEWHNYKHLDWISVRRDDDKIYKFKEGDFKRLRLQDIKDMLLLLVQGKLSNLTVEERFAFNVSLRMFTRSIVIQRRVEDLQLGVDSYQKRLNLTKPDTLRDTGFLWERVGRGDGRARGLVCCGGEWWRVVVSGGLWWSGAESREEYVAGGIYSLNLLHDFWCLNLWIRSREDKNARESVWSDKVEQLIRFSGLARKVGIG
nr:hypothetical protein [Tanacetum cinerariifolium]